MSGDIITATLETYGIWGLILLIIALIALAGFVNIVSKLSFMSIWKRRQKRISGASNALDSSLHDNWFFTNAKFKMRFDIPSLELNPNNEALTQVYRDLIYLNVESYYYGCKRLIETHDTSTMSGAEWENIVKCELQSMINSFRNKAEDFGVPHVAVSKYSKWLKPYTTLLNTHIEQLASATMYGDASYLRMHVFLLIMNLMIVVMIGDLDKLANEETDEFEGIDYRGTHLYN
jgi:hypothetical protein